MGDRICAIVGVGPGNGSGVRAPVRGGRLPAGADGPHGREARGGGGRGAGEPGGDRRRRRSGLGARGLRARSGASSGRSTSLLYNAGSGQWGTFQEITPKAMEAGWRTNVLGLLVAGQAVADDMIARGAGAIVVTGATASLRGNVQTAAFASAKAGQRALAQSMARHLGPKGVHVGYVIVDGVIDLAADPGADGRQARRVLPQARRRSPRRCISWRTRTARPGPSSSTCGRSANAGKPPGGRRRGG